MLGVVSTTLASWLVQRVSEAEVDSQAAIAGAPMLIGGRICRSAESEGPLMGVGTKNSNAAEAAAVDAERPLARPRAM